MLQKIRDSINALTWIHRTAEVITGLVVPVLVGLVATFQDKLLEVSPFLFWALLISLALIALVLTIASLGVKSAPEIYLDWQHERDTNANIEKDIRYCTLLESETLAMNALVRGYVADGLQNQDELSAAIEQICAGFVDERNTYFGFDYREMWNFAVYLWDENDHLLKPVWREKARTHPSTTEGRTWADNEGHVGHAFHSRKELITPNAQAADVAAVLGANNNSRPYDATTYLSYVSEPILATDPEALPYGVLVATSNKVGRYDPANSRVLKHAAVAVATLMETAYDSP